MYNENANDVQFASQPVCCTFALKMASVEGRNVSSMFLTSVWLLFLD